MPASRSVAVSHWVPLPSLAAHDMHTICEAFATLSKCPDSQNSQLDEPGKLVVFPSLPGVVGHMAHASW